MTGFVLGGGRDKPRFLSSLVAMSHASKDTKRRALLGAWLALPAAVDSVNEGTSRHFSHQAALLA